MVVRRKPFFFVPAGVREKKGEGCRVGCALSSTFINVGTFCSDRCPALCFFKENSLNDLFCHEH